MRAAIIALMLMTGSQVAAECVNLCDRDWWKTATEADVQAGLNDGADVMARNKHGTTPLHDAAGTDNFTIADTDPFFNPSKISATIQILLAAGADVMARDWRGYTPLHSATATFCYELNAIKTLIAAGSDVMALDKCDNTPLHYIVENYPSEQINNKFGAIDALLKAGASIKEKNKNGKTPWDLAQENENLKAPKATGR